MIEGNIAKIAAMGYCKKVPSDQENFRLIICSKKAIRGIQIGVNFKYVSRSTLRNKGMDETNPPKFILSPFTNWSFSTREDNFLDIEDSEGFQEAVNNHVQRTVGKANYVTDIEISKIKTSVKAFIRFIDSDGYFTTAYGDTITEILNAIKGNNLKIKSVVEYDSTNEKGDRPIDLRFLSRFLADKVEA